MDPEFVQVDFTVYLGPNGHPLIDPPTPPGDSPLKVWTGSEWVSTGVTVSE